MKQTDTLRSLERLGMGFSLILRTQNSETLPIISNLWIPMVRMELKPSFEYEKDLKTTLRRRVNDRPPTFIESQLRFENHKLCNLSIFYPIRKFQSFYKAESYC